MSDLNWNHSDIVPDAVDYWGEILQEIPYQRDITPEGDAVLVFGNPRGDSQFVHLQGDNSLGLRGTCGLCSVEGVLNQYGIHVTEDDVVRYAAEYGLCTLTDNPLESGGSSPLDQARILTDFGVPAHAEMNLSLDDLASHVESGQSVIIECNVGMMFDNADAVRNPYQYNHAIVVTGVAREAETGEILGLYVNDTGGFCTNEFGQVQGGTFVDARHVQAGWSNVGGHAVIPDAVRV